MSRVVKKYTGKSKIQNATKVQLEDGTKFRSKLEYYTYSKLKENGINDFDYEKTKFVLMDGFDFTEESIEDFEMNVEGAEKKAKMFGPINNKIRPITYLPDFTCIRPDKTGWIIECKGYSNDALNHFKIRSALYR